MAFILEHIIDFCASVESALSVGWDSPAQPIPVPLCEVLGMAPSR